jgi:uncharacterized protein YkwD
MTQPHPLRHIPLVLLLAMVPLSASADIIGAVNKVRTQGCAGRPGVRPTLRESSRLDEVARQLSRGAELRLAQKTAGYHAVTSASVEISGVQDNGNIERIVGQRFCSQSTEPAFREIGTFQRGTDVWIAVAQPFSPPAPRDAAAISRRILELTNQARSHARRCGSTTFAAAPALSLDATLERAALEHSKDMSANDYMNHTGRDGSSPADRVTHAGYTWRMVGENLASGVMTPDEVVEGWLESPHHCANLMGPKFLQMGVAYAVNPSTEAGVYWTQVFGTPP